MWQERFSLVGHAPDSPTLLPLAKDLGADLTIDSEDDLVSFVRAETDGLGVDAAIECTGLPSIYSVALRAIRPQGRRVIMKWTGKGFPIDGDRITTQGLSLLGSGHAPSSSWEQAIQLLGEKKIELTPQMTNILPRSRWREGIQQKEEHIGVWTVLTTDPTLVRELEAEAVRAVLSPAEAKPEQEYSEVPAKYIDDPRLFES